ncbi:MAG TPA: sulfotransferase [Rhizomicrobium sp.]|jgi:hypothetical protein|nr:sulfotransferase [Rhizomicrobium sp.]
MPFVIIASPRTGSTHLTTLLHKRPDVICHGELLHPKKETILGRWRDSDRVPVTRAQLTEIRDKNPKEFIQQVFSNDRGGCQVGFKIFAGHNDALLDQLIADSSIKKVILYRRNALAVYSSSRIAHRFGERVRRTARPSQPVVSFEAEKFVKFCKKYAAFYRSVIQKLNAHQQFFYLLHYEEINDPWLFSCLLNFIGADSKDVELRATSIKQNSSEILKRFSNSGAAEEFLRAHELLEWSYEAEVSLTPFSGVTEHISHLGGWSSEQPRNDIGSGSDGSPKSD